MQQFFLRNRSITKLTVCAALALLKQFDCTIGKIEKSSLVDHMTSLCNKRFNANHLINIILQKNNSIPLIAFEKLKFFTFNLPSLRFILHQIHVYIMPALPTSKPNKLLLTKDLPLLAQFWELAINLIYVETAVLHASLSDKEQIQFVEQFNNLDDPFTVSVIMHSISAQRVNLDRCCNQIIVVINAVNASFEWQIGGRVIRYLLCAFDSCCHES